MLLPTLYSPQSAQRFRWPEGSSGLSMDLGTAKKGEPEGSGGSG